MAEYCTEKARIPKADWGFITYMFKLAWTAL